MGRGIARCSLLVAALLLAAGGIADAGERPNRVADPKGDVSECDGTMAVPENAAADIRQLRVLKNAIIEVRVRRSIKKSLRDQFSFAILVGITLPDGSRREFLVQVHDGQVTIGEVDPTTGEPLSDSPPVKFNGPRARVTPGTALPSGADVDAQSFNLPSSSDAQLCDQASLTLSQAVEPRQVAPREPPIVGSVDEVL